MPWFRIVAAVAAMEPSLLIPARIKIRAIRRRPSAETDDTSVFIAFIQHLPLSDFFDYQHLRSSHPHSFKHAPDRAARRLAAEALLERIWGFSFQAW